jgi:hypothetical protein
MTTSPPRNYTRLAIAVVAAALVAGTALYAASYTGTTTVTKTSTVAETTTISSTPTCVCPTTSTPCPCTSGSGSSTSPSSNSSVACVETGIHGTLYVRVVGDNESQPIQGANVTATILGYCSPYNNYAVAMGFTNSTGYAPMAWTWTGSYLVSVAYASTDYTFPAQTSGSISLVTLSVPSGLVVERSIGCYGLGCENNTATATASSTSSSTTTSSSSTVISKSSPSISTAAVILALGATYQVQSSNDCLAGHSALSFNVTSASLLEGGMSAGQPGVTVYLSSAQEAQTTEQGHPTAWVYSSGLTNSTSLSLTLSPGSYVLWIEGADIGCGSSTVMPLEQLTTVMVTQAVTLTPL